MDDAIKQIQVVFTSVIGTAMSFRGESIASLAKKIDVSPKYLNQVLRCAKPINFILLAKIQKALDVRFDALAIK